LPEFEILNENIWNFRTFRKKAGIEYQVRIFKGFERGSIED
jgi:hypothetical protein